MRQPNLLRSHEFIEPVQCAVGGRIQSGNVRITIGPGAPSEAAIFRTARVSLARLIRSGDAPLRANDAWSNRILSNILVAVLPSTAFGFSPNDSWRI
ncbi:hypothetical protein [Mesorhizobium sp. 113-1-2]|uniref:hypothetical protein n=1 Tax=Mesorhizobium sp. 113-1-2 TaxID=2744515 RepID=UPI001AED57EF|nr:hypothetical protein [Mesorhizobium sp. 113-1-2]